MQGLAVVIGAAGHLGDTLVRRLVDAGRPVQAVDVEDRAALGATTAAADVVFHLTGPLTIASGDDLLAPIDLTGVATVLDACVTNDVRRLVHVNGTAALVPAGPTGEERLVQRATDAGLDAVVVYPTAIFGPGDPGRGHLDRMLLDVWRGEVPARVGGGFDWVDVRDVADGVVAAATRGPAGGRYLLSGTWSTVDDVVARAAVIGRSGPPPDSPASASLRSPLAPPRAADPFDPARARLDLGYLPRPIDDTLRDTYAWFAERGLLRAGRPTRDLVPA